MSKEGGGRHVNMAHARSAEQLKLMERSAAEGACIFCEDHLRRFHVPPILRRGTYWIVTPNMYPYAGARHHILFISRAHIEDIGRLPPEAMHELGVLTKWVAKKMKLDGGTVFMRFGDSEYTGATISHIHAHLVSGGTRLKRGKERPAIETRIGYRV